MVDKMKRGRDYVMVGIRPWPLVSEMGGIEGILKGSPHPRLVTIIKNIGIMLRIIVKMRSN